jgi:hypothetical protein
MRSTGARVALAVAAIAAVVILFIVLSGGNDNNSSDSNTTATSTTGGSKSQTTQVPAAQVIVVQNGEPQGGIKKLNYKKNDQVRLVVRSDVADEIHVHGYDLKQDVPAGGSVRFNFPATIEGVFEIELENRKQQIAELRVSPS